MNILAMIGCVIAAGVKLPRAVRGEGRVSFFGLVFLAFGLLLSIPEVYVVIDGWLGNHNLTNIIIRMMVQFVGVAAAVSLARVFRAYRVESFALSLPGYAAVVVSVVAMGAMLVPMGAWGHSSPGLGDFVDSPWNLLYGFVGTLYPTILAAILLVPVMRFVTRSKGASIPRIAYLMMAIGMVALIIVCAVEALALVGILELQNLITVVGWIAPLGFAAGMLLHALWSFGVRVRTAQAKKAAAAA